MTARAQPDRRKWTAAQVRALGVRCSVPQAGEILGGLSATQSYLLAQRGDFPVPILKVGRRLIVPTAPILQLLGLSDHGGRAQPAPLRPVDDPDNDAPLGQSGQGIRIPAAPPSAQPTPRTPDAERTTQSAHQERQAPGP
jgi:hypothetical protein